MERRNITLSLPTRLLRKAKVAAARKDKSLSEFMKDALEEKVAEDTGYKKAKTRQLRVLNAGLDLATKGRISISREELHERG